MLLTFLLVLAATAVLCITYAIGPSPIGYRISLWGLAMTYVVCAALHLTGRLTLEVGVGLPALLTLIAATVGASWRSASFDKSARWLFIRRYFIQLPLAVLIAVAGLYWLRGHGYWPKHKLFHPIETVVAPADTLRSFPSHSELTDAQTWNELKRQNP